MAKNDKIDDEETIHDHFEGEADDGALAPPSDADFKAAHHTEGEPVVSAASAEGISHAQSFGGPVTDSRSTQGNDANTAPEGTPEAPHMANAGPAAENVEAPPSGGVAADSGRRGTQS